MALSQYANEAAPATRYIDFAPDSVRYAEEGKGAPAPLYGRGLPHWVAALSVRVRAIAVRFVLNAAPPPPPRFFIFSRGFLFSARAPVSAVRFLSAP